MTSKSAFTEEEWTRVCRAPFVAGMAISIADPGGPIEVAKESMASIRAAAEPPGNEELLQAVAAEIKDLVQRRQNPMAGFKPTRGAMAGQEILDELAAVSGIVSAKASPEEAAAFNRWLVSVAQAAADAAKEGGFMGFGAEQVSAGEKAMLERLDSSLGAT